MNEFSLALIVFYKNNNYVIIKIKKKSNYNNISNYLRKGDILVSTVLLTQITRTGTYPAQIPLDVTYNRGFISFVTNNWTAQMFYELPAIKLDLYTDVEGTMVRSPLFSRTIKTYNPTFPLDQQCSICISMKDVPTNCYLFVTPIFDNNAIEARNELIRNGIEDGQLWTTKTNIFNILLSYEDNDSIPTNTITQQPPISFTADGTSLFSWSMKGNGSQTGTPTPDNPIQPTFCGVRTAQRFLSDDRTAIIASCTVKYEKGVISIVGTASNSGGRLSPATDTIHLEVGTYTISLSQSIIAVLFLQNAQDNTNYYSILSGTTSKTFTINEEADYYVSFNLVSGTTYDEHAYFMLNSGSTALPYEPYGWSEKITCAGQTVPVFLGQTQTVRRIKKLVLTGEETGWQGAEASGGRNRFVLSVSDATTADTSNPYSICSHLPLGSTGETYLRDNLYTIASGKLYMRLTIDYDTLITFKSYLAQQYAAGTPVTIWYVLATEQTAIINEPLCKIGDYADELSSTDAGVTIPTVKGQNTLTVEGDLPPSSMTITGNIK